MQNLIGKVAFVTGGTRGMGEAIVRRFAKEGAIVVFTYAISSERANEIVLEITESGGKALAIKADASKKDAVKAAIDTAVVRFGKIDILVNNAAISVLGPLDQVQDRAAEYDRMVDVNIRSVADAIRHTIQFMPEHGRIINIGSSGGKRVGSPYLSDYVGTKAAIAGYTRGLAWDMAPKHITVNTVDPGAIDTDMLPSDPGIREGYLNVIPLKRFGRPDEVAALVNFLAGPEAGYITGSSLSIDGGINA